MIRIKQFLLIVLTITMLAGCNLVNNFFEYRNTTKEFVNCILKKDYDNAIKFLALEHPDFAGVSLDTLRSKLPVFHNKIVGNFGEQLELTMMTTEKKWSTEEGASTPPNATVVLMQFANNNEFGVLKVLFDDNSKKVIFIKILDVKQPIPNMTMFWLFGLLTICVPIFNIYVIKQIKKSNLRKKWLKYIAVIFFNVPAITYAAVNGLSFDLLSFQIMLGFSFSFVGYISSTWTLGLPLGAFYWFWKLKQTKINKTEQEIAKDETTEPDLAINDSFDIKD